MSFTFHFLLDVFAPALRADATGTVSTIAVPLLDGLLTREKQGTFKIPILQRSAPPRRPTPQVLYAVPPPVDHPGPGPEEPPSGTPRKAA